MHYSVSTGAINLSFGGAIVARMNEKGLALGAFAAGVIVGMLVRVGIRSQRRKAEHDIAFEKLRHSGEFFLSSEATDPASAISDAELAGG
ncbi:MAG TPA: hypothetical protein VNC11_02455 [Gemmatimonadaceae bacterium]|jgi:hypothetical protein|nr:hypothetical protein [Gemmatimonadaceae bacterium]